MAPPNINNLPVIQRAFLAWHDAHAMPAPWREAGDPYACLVAAVMAQQTQMARVMPSYERFTAAFPTIEALAAASAGDVIRVWAGMGYNQRAVRLHRAAQTITRDGWPRDAASLALIPGIGPFTAAIIASFAFGQAAACVDTNVRRVLGRLAGDEAIDGAALQRLADASLARKHPARWNQALMDYGATVCTPRPNCSACVVARHCASGERYAAPPMQMVADERATYDARPKRKAKVPEAPFEGSTRYYRGRIIDALRDLPPGATLRIEDLPARIPNGAALSGDGVRELCVALERHGLAVISGDAVSLPG